MCVYIICLCVKRFTVLLSVFVSGVDPEEEYVINYCFFGVFFYRHKITVPHQGASTALTSNHSFHWFSNFFFFFVSGCSSWWSDGGGRADRRDRPGGDFREPDPQPDGSDTIWRGPVESQHWYRGLLWLRNKKKHLPFGLEKSQTLGKPEIGSLKKTFKISQLQECKKAQSSSDFCCVGLRLPVLWCQEIPCGPMSVPCII